MDLVYTGIPAPIIPTPGQIEQEYLAVYLQAKGPWCFQSQDELDVQKAWSTRNEWAQDHIDRPIEQESEHAVISFLQRLSHIF